MKKAREYAKEWSLNNNNDQIDKQDFIAAVKQIQEEAIRETVEECAENAKLNTKYYTEDDHRMLYLKFKDKGYPRLDGYGMQYAVDIVGIDKNSILSVADKLIKEL